MFKESNLKNTEQAAGSDSEREHSKNSEKFEEAVVNEIFVSAKKIEVYFSGIRDRSLKKNLKNLTPYISRSLPFLFDEKNPLSSDLGQCKEILTNFEARSRQNMDIFAKNSIDPKLNKFTGDPAILVAILEKTISLREKIESIIAYEKPDVETDDEGDYGSDPWDE